MTVQVEAGEFEDLYVSTGVRQVRGRAERVTVAGGATAAVQGIVSGPVTVERGGKLCIDGLFTGTVERNDGLLVLAGQADLDLARRHGRIGIATGSVIRSRGRVWQLTDDGMLRALDGTDAGLVTRTDVDAGKVHYFDNVSPSVAD